MIINRLLTILVIFTIPYFSYSQKGEYTYNKFERKSNEFIEQQFKKNHINSKKLINTFDQYFIDKKVIDVTDEDTTKYNKIFHYLVDSYNNDDLSQLFKNLEDLNLNNEIALTCLNKVYDYYTENRKYEIPPFNFRVIGTCIEFLQKDSVFSPILYVGALQLGHYQDEFYKKALVLVIYSIYHQEK